MCRASGANYRSGLPAVSLLTDHTNCWVLPILAHFRKRAWMLRCLCKELLIRNQPGCCLPVLQAEVGPQWNTKRSGAKEAEAQDRQWRKRASHNFLTGKLLISSVGGRLQGMDFRFERCEVSRLHESRTCPSRELDTVRT